MTAPQHNKPTMWSVCPAKTQINLGICPVGSVFAVRMKKAWATHWVHSKDSDQTGQMPRLIQVFAGCTLILLVYHVAAHVIHNIIFMHMRNFIQCFKDLWGAIIIISILEPCFPLPRVGLIVE